MNEHDLDLLQREVDGLTTEAEDERLRSLIVSDPKLRAARDELQAVNIAFASFQEHEPPPGLKASIMNALPVQSSRVTTAPSRSWWAGLTDRVLTPRPVTLAYAFALGAVIAFAVSTVLIPTGNFDTGDVVGTMGNSQGAVTIESTTHPITGDGIIGSVVVGTSTETAVVQIVWESDSLVEATIEYNDSEMSIVRTENRGTPRIFRTSMSPGTFSIEGSGSIDEVVSFETFNVAVSDFDITITSQDEVVFDYISADSK